MRSPSPSLTHAGHKEVFDRHEIKRMIGECPICRLALCDGGFPYVLPLCFAFVDERLFFHCAPAGRKLDMLRSHPRVGFVFDRLLEILPADRACAWSMRYESVIGTGLATVVHDPALKHHALTSIACRYGATDPHFNPGETKHIAVIQVEILTLSGKSSPPPPRGEIIRDSDPDSC